MLLIISFIFLSSIPSSAHPTGASLDFLTELDLGVGHNVSLFQNVTRRCGTPGPSNELRQAHADFLDQSRHNKRNRQASSPIVVQTYVHFVSTTDQANHYPSSVRTAMVTAQVRLPPSLFFQICSLIRTAPPGLRPHQPLPPRRHLLQTHLDHLDRERRLGHRRQLDTDEAIPPPRQL